ncbi:hypothetical protein SAMN04487996_13827 [Dyadobacter soli]|uniref:Lipocalin-like domain-containing protein n=1 Tax=Dyadobacter soli TaxID=659014 RepID=A0A1G8CKJ6_9BACT|nr:hypothetical protein [Dyadobacter soli]SDH46077.1 hypothetical protein SAMN04487996_13827 [Dyadobacter soli]
MKKHLTWLICLTVIAACQPKKVEPINIGKIWKAKTVKENGQLVYSEGSAANIRPSYTLFRLDLTAPDQAKFTDLDGRKLTGTWSLSTDNNRLILENLSPPPSLTSGNVEFYLTVPPSENQLELKRTAESRKTGNSVNEYVLVPD